MEMKGKVAVITGAGRGIGRAIALRCAREGMHVVLAGIGLESLSETERDLQALGAQTLIVQTDVSKLSDVENLADQAFAAFDTVDLLVNNAGVAAPGSVLESTFDDWKWVIGVNFYGVLHGVKLFAPRLIEQATPSRIVNVSSVAGIIPDGESYARNQTCCFVADRESLRRIGNESAARAGIGRSVPAGSRRSSTVATTRGRTVLAARRRS